MNPIKVLVAPLDWGLGHASRCIPVINMLIEEGCIVSVASSGRALHYLQQEFPQLTFFKLTGYDPEYPSSGSMTGKMIRQLPHFVRVISREHQELEKLIEDHSIDAVISDNRYGCWSARVPCVFITHQSNILMPRRFGWLSPVISFFNHRMMKRFTSCWIPDREGHDSLSGKLTGFNKKSLLDVRFIGPLSRFKHSHADSKYEVCLILSGPEPQRTRLESIVVPQLRSLGLEAIVIRGIPEGIRDVTEGMLRTVDFMTTQALQQIILESNLVIARSGYSTVMDMSALHKRVIFIPTPGQTEQEYLAARLLSSSIAYATDQESFDLRNALERSKAFTGFDKITVEESALRKTLLTFLHEKVHP